MDLGAGEGVQDRWLEWLRSGDAPAGAVLVPCNDDGLELIARHREELEARGLRPAEAGDDGVLAMLDKDRTREIALAAGIPAPRSVIVSSPGELEAALAELDWPVVLKPVRSHEFARHYGMGTKVLEGEEPATLARAFEEVSRLGVEMLLTEIVPGPEDAFCSYYSYLDERGEPLLHLTKRKLRQYPPRFGLGCLHVTDQSEEVAEAGLAFFRAAGLRGLACVEFKRDSRDGRLKLIECNHRLTLATELLRRAGADLPLFVYARAAGLPAPEIRYRTGVSLWAPGRDVRALLADPDLGAGAWLRSVARPHTFLLASARDPRPALGSVGSKALRRLSR